MGEIFNRTVLKEKRRKLRTKATYPEYILWQSLNKHQLEGRKFRRQQSIGCYIVDFYCPSEYLIVELDGADHFTEEGLEHDRARTEYLTGLGLKVIRFENQEVLYNVSYVLNKIKECFKYKK